MVSIVLILAVYAHIHALLVGLKVLHTYQPEFSAGWMLDKGLDDVEKCYIAIVLSTILVPVSLYHIGLRLFRGDELGADTTQSEGVYWLAIGFLLTVFHVITGKLMARVKRSGLHTRVLQAPG